MGVHERQQRAELIMSAAGKVFFVQGFHGTKMEHVARQAGLSKGILYFYYKNKEDLYMALIYHSLQEFIAFHQQSLQRFSDKNGLERMIHFVQDYFEFVETHPYAHAAITDYIRMANPGRQLNAEAGLTEGMKASKYYKMTLKEQLTPALMLFEVINKGRIDGSIKHQGDYRLLYATLWSLIIGYEQLSVAERFFTDTQKTKLQYFQLDRKEWKEMIVRTVRTVLTSPGT